MSAEALHGALLALGLPCDVDGRERLALLRLRGDAAVLADRALRGRVTTLAAEHGYTHVALELAVPGDAGH